MSLVFGNGSYTRNPVNPQTGQMTNTSGKQGQDWQWSNPSQPFTPQQSQQPQAKQSGGMDMSAYKPGQAQSVQPQSQGTAYQPYVNQSGQQFSGTQSYAPGTSEQYQNEAYGGWANSQGYSQPSQYFNSPAGNMANDPSGYRPPPYAQSAVGVNGRQFSDPSQAFAQRDALIQRLNDTKSQYAANAGVYQGDGAPPPSWGQRPQYDFGQLAQQANQMVQQGWQNPFSGPATSTGAMPPMAQPSSPWLTPIDGPLTQDQRTFPQAPRMGQAQPIQPPSQGNRLGEPGPELIADPRIARRTGQLASAPDERADPAYYSPPSQQAQVPSGPAEPDWNSVIQKYRAADGVLRHGYDSTNPAHVQALQDRKAAAELMSQGRDKRDQKQEQDRLALPRDEYLNRYVAGGASAQRKREAEALAKAKQFSPWRKPFVPPWQEQNPSGPVQNDGFNQWLDRTPGYVRDDANLPALRELYRYQQDPLAALRNAGFRI